MKNAFIFPMRKSERIAGCVFIIIHAVLLPLFLAYLLSLIQHELAAPHITLIYYTTSFILVTAVMFQFLRESFSDFIGDFWRVLQAGILGYALYWVLSFLLAQVISGENPNTQQVIEEARINLKVMAVVSAVLAPIVEETLFRGALFGTIRQKNRLLAYIVSAVVFSAYHLWQEAVFNFDWNLLLISLQYVPASIALTWSYERGGTIWTPIILHAVINVISLSIYF